MQKCLGCLLTRQELKLPALTTSNVCEYSFRTAPKPKYCVELFLRYLLRDIWDTPPAVLREAPNCSLQRLMPFIYARLIHYLNIAVFTTHTMPLYGQSEQTAQGLYQDYCCFVVCRI